MGPCCQGNSSPRIGLVSNARYVLPRDQMEWTFMNYGYAIAGQHAAEKQYEGMQAHCIELCRQVARNADLSGKSLLEVGCGRGGGSAFLHKYFQLQSVVGVDLSSALKVSI